MKKRYFYNVSYHHSAGLGTSQIVRDEKIKSIEDFIALKELIERENNFKNVGIINFQLIGKQRKKEG